MPRQELIKLLKIKNPDLNNSDFNQIIDIFCEEIEKSLTNSKKIEFRGFGTFSLKTIKEKYSARNPKTGELIYVPKKNKIKFKPSKKLKEYINK